MTINSATNKVIYTANGVLTDFDFTFKTFQASDIQVYLDDVLQGSGYSVTLNSDQETSPGGTVIFDVAPADQTNITIVREVPLSQNVDYQPYDPFPANTHEAALDKLTMQNQQQQEELDRTTKASVSDDGSTDYTLPLYDAGKAIIWDDPVKQLVNSDDEINGITDAAQQSADDSAASAAASAASADDAAASAVEAAGYASDAADSASDAADSAATAANLVIGHNLIINGGMEISQRFNAPTATGGGDGYIVDRWLIANVGSQAMLVGIDSDTPDGVGFGQSQSCQITTADVAIAAGDYSVLLTRIEGKDTAHLLQGDAAAKTVTLSFDVKSSVIGTYCVAFRNAATDRNYIAEYTINVADTWESKTITLTLDTTGTWLTDTGVGLEVSFAMASGSTWQGVADTWQAGNLFATSNQVNFLATIGNKFLLDNVKLEEGTEVTSFLPRPFGDELALCQRYFEKSYDIGTNPGTITNNGYEFVYLSGLPTVAHINGGVINFAVQKRISPTMTSYSPNSGISGRAFDSTGTPADVLATINVIGMSRTNWFASGQINAVSLLTMHWTADAEL